jgi:hypothetical protein
LIYPAPVKQFYLAESEDAVAAAGSWPTPDPVVLIDHPIALRGFSCSYGRLPVSEQSASSVRIDLYDGDTEIFCALLIPKYAQIVDTWSTIFPSTGIRIGTNLGLSVSTDFTTGTLKARSISVFYQ